MLILGLMSGSSLDGIDMALCSFSGLGESLQWKLIHSVHVPFEPKWKKLLQDLPGSSAYDLSLADYDFGNLLGASSKKYFSDFKPDYIASHGHTIFHYPALKMTCQIGNGAVIASASGINTICDFRSMDIGYGGQGAPIVSLFDLDFFGGLDVLVNLGGIANLTVPDKNQTIAYDIGPCNQLLNYLAGSIGLEYDQDGLLAAQGEIDQNLLKTLSGHSYFDRTFPKTLDNGYIFNEFVPILDKSKASVQDKLRTVVELIAKMLSREITMHLANHKTKAGVMFTGGGAKNTFLMETFRKKAVGFEMIETDDEMIDFKEAIMMAYLGYLRVKGKINVLSKVTGASKDSIGGSIYLA